jgi:hypothetical protein
MTIVSFKFDNLLILLVPDLVGVGDSSFPRAGCKGIAIGLFKLEQLSMLLVPILVVLYLKGCTESKVELRLS